MGVDVELEIRLKSELSDEDLKVLNRRFYEACGKDLLRQDRTTGERALMFGHPWDEDLEDSRDWLYFNTFSRYYGEGYERGDWVKLRAIIFWLQTNVDGDLFYYGDCSLRPEEPLGAEGLAALDAHWAKHGYPYFNRGHSSFTSFFRNGEPNRICSFCEGVYSCNGVGGSRRLYYCCGCGQRANLTATGEFIEHGDEDVKVW